MTVLRAIDVVVVVIACLGLPVHKRFYLSLSVVAGVQSAMLMASMVACSADVWSRWTGLGLLMLVEASALLTIVHDQRKEKLCKACW